MAHRTTIAVCILAFALVPFADAATNRVANGDFETGPDDPRVIPGWNADGSMAFRARELGVGGSTAALLVGVATLRGTTFSVSTGESLTFDADVFEMRDDTDGRPGFRGDSVVALTFRTASGSSPLTLEFHCDAYVDLVDNGVVDESDTCTARDGFVHIAVPNPAIACGPTPTPECRKYRDPIVVPTGVTHAVVALGGSPALDLVVSSPTSLTAFDNVVVSS